MSKKNQNLTEGPLARQIMTFSVPLMLSNVLQVMFNMADVAVVGRFAGALALGAVGSTTILVHLLTGFQFGVSSGVNVLTARHLGAKSEKDVEETVHTSALLCLIVGLILMAIGLIFARSLLNLLNTKPELIDGAALYLRIYCLGLPAMATYNFGNAVLSAAGDTRRPLYFLTTAGVVNVLLNLFFVIACGMDVEGVALASVISQYISAAMIVISLLRSRESYALRLNRLRIHGGKARTILAIGLPSGGQNWVFAFANLFIQAGINSFDATMVAGNAAAGNADALVYDVMAAFYTACSSFLSQNFGARKKNRMLKSFYITTAYSFGVGAVLGCLLALFGRPFLSLFTTEPAVVEAGMKKLSIMGFSYCVSAFMDNAIAASRGLGKSVAPMIIVIMGSCVFRVIWVFTVFAYFHTVASLYLLYVFSWTITATVELIYFARVFRRETRLAGL